MTKNIFKAMLAVCAFTMGAEASRHNLDDQAYYYEEGVTYRHILMHVVNQKETYDQDLVDWINRFANMGSGELAEPEDISVAYQHNTCSRILQNLIGIDADMKKGRRNVGKFSLNKEGETLVAPFSFTYNYAQSIVYSNSYRAKQKANQD